MRSLMPSKSMVIGSEAFSSFFFASFFLSSLSLDSSEFFDVGVSLLAGSAGVSFLGSGFASADSRVNAKVPSMIPSIFQVPSSLASVRVPAPARAPSGVEASNVTLSSSTVNASMGPSN